MINNFNNRSVHKSRTYFKDILEIKDGTKVVLGDGFDFDKTLFLKIDYFKLKLILIIHFHFHKSFRSYKQINGNGYATLIHEISSNQFKLVCFNLL